MLQPIICLMGPTASGKTPLAIEIAARFPCDIISVDSALVYRGMDIGTAKPDHATLARTPHQLVDICEPSAVYSAGDFHRDALAAIANSHAQQRIPLLVGGTMLYFRTLLQGISALPKADESVRQDIAEQAATQGWEKLHAKLAAIDAPAAARIKPLDKQRIQRALEVWYVSGKTMTAWQAENHQPLNPEALHWLAITPSDRLHLHARIAERFEIMLQQGFVDEVKVLMARGDLHAEMASQRAVGYRQAWRYLANEIDYTDFKAQAVAATRQLAKRQLTWLRSWPTQLQVDLAQGEKVMAYIGKLLSSRHF